MPSFKPFGLELHAGTHQEEVKILKAGGRVVIEFVARVSRIELKRGSVDLLNESDAERVKLVAQIGCYASSCVHTRQAI